MAQRHVPPTARPLITGLSILASALVALAQLVPALGTCASADGSWLSNSLIAFSGWAAVTCGVFAWYANPLFAICAISLMRGREPSSWLWATQLALALSALLPMKLPVGEELEPMLVCNHGPGFWLWLAGQLTLVISAVAVRFTRT